MGKVLIKGKKLPPGQDEISEDDEALEIDPSVEVKAKKKQMRKHASAHGKKEKKKIKLASELSNVVSYIRGAHFKGFKDSYDKEECDNICSFSEGTALEHLNHAETAGKYVQRNKRQMTRTYPAGFRVTSTNYNPIPMWNGGSQLVALNYQTYCHEMAINLGKFRDNAGSGYLLKPHFQRDLKIQFNPVDPSTFAPEDARFLTIRVISAQMLPKPELAEAGEIIDPYVVLDVLGVPADEKKVHTKTVNNNGFNPVWNEAFAFRLQVPDLAIIYFNVYDKDEMSKDDFIAQSAIPFHSLQEGYRHVHLRTKSDQLIPGAAIFIHVSKSRVAEPLHLAEQAQSMPRVTSLPSLHKHQLEEHFKEVVPMLLQPKECNDKIQAALHLFAASLTLPREASFASAVDTLIARVNSQGATLGVEEVNVPNTQLSTYRMRLLNLPAEIANSFAISYPLRMYENLRCVVEDVVRVQAEQSIRLQQCITVLHEAHRDEDKTHKEKKADAAIDQRVKLVEEAMEEHRTTAAAVREIMRITFDKLKPATAPRDRRSVLVM